MVTKARLLEELRESGVVAVIRTEDPADLVAVCRGLHRGGVRFVEITMTVPGALDVVHDAVRQLADTDVRIGVGTVLDGETARAAILAGAGFVVAPAFDADVVRVCRTYGTLVMPGALTPTEVVTAWKGGADVVKIFPADVGGPGYLAALKEPLPQVELLPTKGVNLETAAAFIRAGAIAVGAGTALVSRQQIAERDADGIAENARRFTRVVREAKGVV
jgi:2-dehydro-3-deoxyphosphogluconate aldolase/(4S)-4-hydroxy-2-oxoglutarate aldolase